MGRKILFKAKKLSDGKWIEGSLVTSSQGTFIATEADASVFPMTMDEVDPSTVCQFTGLKDREGNEIFEHDLLTNDGTAAYKVGYIGSGYAASYKDEDYFMFHLPSLSKSCLVYGNDLDRKEGEV